jgi:1-acyl-sn-glycerol-3-phosphate acyltransferase
MLADLRLLRQARDLRGRSRTPRSVPARPWPDRSSAFATDWARTAGARATREALQRIVLKPVTWSQVAPEVAGLDRLEGLDGPAVFVANHSSHLDAPLIIGSLPRRLVSRLAVGAAGDYFFDARWRALATALVFGAFPVERPGSGRGRSSLAPSLLSRGWSLLLFPEGTRSADGWMGSLRLGAAHLCVRHGVPLVPVVLRGTYAAMPRGRGWPVRGRPRVVVRYGRPMYPAEGEHARAFHRRMTEQMTVLWAEEDLGWYGSLRARSRGELSLPTAPPLPAGVDGSTVPAPALGAGSWRRVWEAGRPMRPNHRPRVWRL